MAAPDELIVLGVPSVTLTADSGNSAQTIIGAPALRWQSAQWHIDTEFGTPESS
jgi:hypothetical protein